MIAATLSGLPRIDPLEAMLRRDVIAALTGRRIGAALFTARMAAAPDRRGGWLTCQNGAAIAIDRIDGEAQRLELRDGLAAIALVERAEALLRTIEAALGVELEPENILADPPRDSLIVTLAGAADGEVRHAVRLALPRSIALLPAPGDFAPELVAAIAVPATVRIEGPRLAPHDAAQLVPGDCILLGAGPLAAILSASPLPDIAGTLDPAARRFRSQTPF